MENKGFQEGLYTRFKIENFNNTSVNSVVNQPVPFSYNPDEAIRFDNKSDEDIVYGSDYKPLRTIDELINNDESSKSAIRKIKKGRIPRRLNNFMIYRRDKCVLPRFSGLKACVVTDEISEMWNDEPPKVIEYYSALSRMAKKNHIQKYGEDYKYRPGPYKKQKKNKKDRKEKLLDKPKIQAVTPSSQQQLLTPETSPVVLTPQTSNSSPVLEEPLPVEQNFPQLSAILPLPKPQQYLLTPESNSDSLVSSPSEPELNFAELDMFPPLNTVIPVVPVGQQAIMSSQENNYDAINLLKIPQQSIGISSLSTTDLLQALASSFDSFDSVQNNQCMQYNDDFIDETLQQDDATFNNNYDFPLFDDTEQQSYDNSQMNDEQQQEQQAMMLLSEYFNATKYNDNPFFNINLPVQQYDNSFQNNQFDNNTIEQQEQDFENLFDFSQWNIDDISNIAFDSNLFKKSE